MRGEIARREEELQRTLASQRQREEANLETRMAERQALQRAEHAQLVSRACVTGLLLLSLF